MIDAAKLVVKGYGAAGYQKVIVDSPLPVKGKRKTLVFVLAFCYTGFGARVAYPCRKVMAENGESRYHRKKIAIGKNK